MKPKPESQTEAASPAATRGKAMAWSTVVFAAILAACYAFPSAWYTRKDPGRASYWLAEGRQIAGWRLEQVPVAESAERLLVADELFNGEFAAPDGRRVRAFSAKRHAAKENEIGLFVHTPDRCWVEAGWRIEAAAPESIEMELHGLRLEAERRVFIFQGRKELVYFFGLVAGQPPPFRLDHNLGVGMRSGGALEGGAASSALRATDPRLWSRLWESFLTRSPLLGPKQFVRISTPVTAEGLRAADEVLRSFLPLWLRPVPFSTGSKPEASSR